MDSLRERRKKAILATIGVCLANAGTAATFTPGVETCKHAIYSVTEIGLCITIYNIYFGRKLSKVEIERFLLENGVATSAGGGLAFVGTKLGHSAINEILNFIPVIGWGIKGILAGSITASIGFAVIETCHQLAPRT